MDNPIYTYVMARAAGRSARAISLEATQGRYPDLLRFLRTAKGVPDLHNLDGLAAAIGVSRDELLSVAAGTTSTRAADPPPRREPARAVRPIGGPFAPIHGSAAGDPRTGRTALDQVIGEVPMPAGLVRARDVYALYVAGLSMSPKYEPGQVVFVTPHVPWRRGDTVIVQVKDASGVSALIKDAEKIDEKYFYGKFYYPEVGTVQVNRDTIVAIHRVAPPNETYGVS